MESEPRISLMPNSISFFFWCRLLKVALEHRLFLNLMSQNQVILQKPGGHKTAKIKSFQVGRKFHCVHCSMLQFFVVVELLIR